MAPPDWREDRADTSGALGDGPTAVPGKDYTPEILQFLHAVHGKIRQDDQGDYYYQDVSTISLHFLLNSQLPSKDMLWAWYDYFDRECSESIYQTLPPLRDEVFLRILDGSQVLWNPETVRSSGLVFLSQHRHEVYAAIEEFLIQRLEAHRHMEEPALRKLLTPKHTWTDAHLKREVRRLQTRPFDRDERQAAYRRLDSDYLRATARHLMDEATTEAFWKAPPPELASLRARFDALRGLLAETAVRMGIYVTREHYETSHWREGRDGARKGRRRAGAGTRGARRSGATDSAAHHLAVLGLPPDANLAQVRAAYRDQVKRHHPDSGGDIHAFLSLQEAYEFLVTQVF